MRCETWPTVESRTVRFSSLVITTFRAQWNAAYVTLGNLLFSVVLAGILLLLKLQWWGKCMLLNSNYSCYWTLINGRNYLCLQLRKIHLAAVHKCEIENLLKIALNCVEPKYETISYTNCKKITFTKLSLNKKIESTNSV